MPPDPVDCGETRTSERQQKGPTQIWIGPFC
jgi:hypothetical protein